MLLSAAAVALATSALGAMPPGPGPFGNTLLPQPVPGAKTFAAPKLCDVSKAPYSATNGSNATAALSAAIADCGDLLALSKDVGVAVVGGAAGRHGWAVVPARQEPVLAEWLHETKRREKRREDGEERWDSLS